MHAAIHCCLYLRPVTHVIWIHVHIGIVCSVGPRLKNTQIVVAQQAPTNQDAATMWLLQIRSFADVHVSVLLMMFIHTHSHSSLDCGAATEGVHPNLLSLS